jgi:hypothetical protein
MTRQALILVSVIGWASCGGRTTPAETELDENPIPQQQPVVVVDPAPEPPIAEPAEPVAPPAQPAPPLAEDVGYACDLASAPGTTDSLLLNPRSRTCRSGMCLHVRGIAHCTDFCAEDADCPASGPECTGGFVCIAPFVVGSPACCRMCVCADALVPSDLRFSEVSCAGRGCTLTPK